MVVGATSLCGSQSIKSMWQLEQQAYVVVWSNKPFLVVRAISLFGGWNHKPMVVKSNKPMVDRSNKPVVVGATSLWWSRAISLLWWLDPQAYVVVKVTRQWWYEATR